MQRHSGCINNTEKIQCTFKLKFMYQTKTELQSSYLTIKLYPKYLQSHNILLQN